MNYNIIVYPRGQAEKQIKRQNAQTALDMRLTMLEGDPAECRKQLADEIWNCAPKQAGADSAGGVVGDGEDGRSDDCFSAEDAKAGYAVNLHSIPCSASFHKHRRHILRLCLAEIVTLTVRFLIGNGSHEVTV